VTRQNAIEGQSKYRLDLSLYDKLIGSIVRTTLCVETRDLHFLPHSGSEPLLSVALSVQIRCNEIHLRFTDLHFLRDTTCKFPIYPSSNRSTGLSIRQLESFHLHADLHIRLHGFSSIDFGAVPFHHLSISIPEFLKANTIAIVPQ